MYFVIFELDIPTSPIPISGEYYATLQNLLKTQPGFISETPYVSPHSSNHQVLVAQFVDEAAVNNWRLQHTHLQIEHRARETVFDDYRLRIGPELSQDSQDEDTAAMTTGKKGHVVVLYSCPVTEGMPVPSSSVTDLIDPAKITNKRLSDNLVDTAVYQAEKTVLWIYGWPDMAAAGKFVESVQRVEGDDVRSVHIVRDYGKCDTKEAPAWADKAQAASVGGQEEGGKGID